jgi:VWFA-related protein
MSTLFRTGRPVPGGSALPQWLAAGCCAVASAGLIASAVGQTPAGQITFSTRTELVQVDARVTDKSGKEVSGLTADDFTISEDGRPQKIALFREAAMPLAGRETDPKLVAPPRDAAVNDATPATRAVVIVLDNPTFTIDPENLAHIKRTVSEILRDLSSDDDVALVFTGRSDLGVNFTNDMASQIVVVDRIKDSFGGAGGARTSLGVLRNVCRLLGNSPHAKRIIYFISQGAAINLLDTNNQAARTVNDDVQALLQSAAQSDVTIYAFDPSGPQLVHNAAGAGTVRLRQLFLGAVTASTGGRVLAGNADLTKGIQQVLTENGRFYVLGYMPDPPSHDGAFHKIEVTTRNSTYRINAREGYMAAAPIDPMLDAQHALQAALGQAFPFRDLRLHATAAVIGPMTNGRVKVRVALQIGPVAQTAGPPWDFRLIAATVDGKGVGTISRTLPESTGAATPSLLEQDIDLPPGRTAVRAGIRSGTAGAIGTIQLTVEVPNIDDERLALGGLMLGQPGVASAGASPIDVFAASPERAFKGDDLPDVMTRIVWQAKDGDSVSVTATVSAAGKTVGHIEATLKGETAGASNQSTFTWHLPNVGQLSAGDYRLEVDAKSGGAHASRAIPFTVK